MASEAFAFWKKIESESVDEGAPSRSPRVSPKTPRANKTSPNREIATTSSGEGKAMTAAASQLDHSELYRPRPASTPPRPIPAHPTKTTGEAASGIVRPHHKAERMVALAPVREAGPQTGRRKNDPPQPVPRSPPRRVATTLTRGLQATLSLESYMSSRLASHSPLSPTKKATTGAKQEPEEQADKEERGGEAAVVSAPSSLGSGRKGSWSRNLEMRVGSPPRRRVATASTKRTNSFVSYLDGPLDAIAVESELASIRELRCDQSFSDEVLVFPNSPPTSSGEKKELVRSSPVITHVPGAHAAIHHTTLPRQLLRDQKVLKSPISLELAHFWSSVSRVIEQASSHKRTFMPSPTISLNKPLSSSLPHQHSMYTIARLPSRVTIAMETALVQCDHAVILQCKSASTVLEVIRDALAMLFHGHSSLSARPENYQLKVCGKDEYMENDRCLLDFEYVHFCLKLSQAVQVVLVETNMMKRITSLRTSMIQLDMSSLHLPHALSHQELNSLLDSYLTQHEQFSSSLRSSSCNYMKMCQRVVSCIRMLCERLAFLEPLLLSEAIDNLKRACKFACSYGGDMDAFSANLHLEMVEDNWNNVSVEDLRNRQDSAAKDVGQALSVLLEAVHRTVEMYCLCFNADYEPKWLVSERELPRLPLADEPLRIHLCAMHRVPQELAGFDTYLVEACIYHGGRPLCRKFASPPGRITRYFFPTVTWNKWMNFGLLMSSLPREARLCLTLYGKNMAATGKECDGGNKEALGWVALPLFTFRGELQSGMHLLGIWRDDSPADPTDSPHNNLVDRKSAVLEIEFKESDVVMEYSLPAPSSPKQFRPPRPHPPQDVACRMQDAATKDRFESLKEEETRLLWDHRSSAPALLCMYTRGLPVFVQSLPRHCGEELCALRSLLNQWPFRDPTFGLELLDSQYPDMIVREKAVEWLSNLPEDDLVDLLPQLTQSMKYDTYVTSATTDFLLSKAVASPRLAHYLYWNLCPLTMEPRFAWRYELLLSALLFACGEEMAMELSHQSDFVAALSSVAEAVKAARDAQRQTTLVRELRKVCHSLPPFFRLPLNPALQCSDIDIENCSFFNSKTVPLKLSLKNADQFGSNINVIFKEGDDLRQDMLTLQLIRLMDKIWLRSGLDLKLVTYQVLATGPDHGMVEIVTESATLRQIQSEYGLTGPFKDKPLSEWLMRHNPTDANWKSAIENFTHSCAGFCVATYVLGICDRHNDNIMVRKSGHMFHIDFGRILGHCQMFGSIKRDRAPFVLTPDMAYVINAGDKPTVRFQKFTDLCCAAYNELRKHSHLFLSILSLMLSSNLPELSSADDLRYVRDALLPQSSDDEATYIFTKHIEASLGSLATQINFFIHSLAQFKFSSTSAGGGGLLSFSPSSYSIATDEKILSAVVVAYHMRFYPEKYIVYQIQVSRVDSATHPSTIIFRRYSEFNEFHHKLEECFPQDFLPQLPGKVYIPGRSYRKETSEKRQMVLTEYLRDLLSLGSHISESDVVYTFLHCLLRDEQDLRKMREEEQNNADTIAGRLKVDLRYNEEQCRLRIMVQHVRELVPRDGTESTDPYVKLYLLPDPVKATKKKTKIARKTLNPTYNEVFHYPLTLPELRSKCLQLTVWDASSLLSKDCLGCVLVELQPLYKELVKGLNTWFELQPASLVNR